jgi:hypothetical protein
MTAAATGMRRPILVVPSIQARRPQAAAMMLISGSTAILKQLKLSQPVGRQQDAPALIGRKLISLL